MKATHDGQYGYQRVEIKSREEFYSITCTNQKSGLDKINPSILLHTSLCICCTTVVVRVEPGTNKSSLLTENNLILISFFIRVGMGQLLIPSSPFIPTVPGAMYICAILYLFVFSISLASLLSLTSYCTD